MRIESTAKIIRRADINVAVSQFEEINIPHVAPSPCAPAELRETPFARLLVARHP
jgi:hypothetical protein